MLKSVHCIHFGPLFKTMWTHLSSEALTAINSGGELVYYYFGPLTYYILMKAGNILQTPYTKNTKSLTRYISNAAITC